MAETVKLPGLGPTKKQYVWAGVALVGGIVIYAWWRAAGTTPTEPPPELEPFEPDLGPPDLGGVSTGGGVTDTGLEFITTNAQWSEAVIGKMIDLGYDSITVATALGKFLANQPVSTTEAQIINSALALQGKPPVGEHSIRLETVSPSPSPSPGAKLPRPGGLRLTVNRPGRFEFVWNRVPGAAWYLVKGGAVGHPRTGPVTTNRKIGLGARKGGNYVYWIKAQGLGTSSDWSEPIRFQSK